MVLKFADIYNYGINWFENFIVRSGYSCQSRSDIRLFGGKNGWGCQKQLFAFEIEVNSWFIDCCSTHSDNVGLMLELNRIYS